MTQIVLITGATSGLGAEFARQLASRGSDLVLVARSAGRLEKTALRLRAQHGVSVETLAADLQEYDGVSSVVNRLTDTRHPVTTLINNAGHGLSRPFADNSLQDELEHLNIHVTVPLTFAHAALQGMRVRGRGHIINIASVAGFTPRGSYGAAKAAIISFSRWANLQYRREGITVTAVCPGFVHTEFHQRMNVDTGAVPQWMWLYPEQVVCEALRDAAAGKAVSIPSRRYKVLTALAQVAPSSLVASFDWKRSR